MSKKKLTIVGAGNVGSAVARAATIRQIGDVVLIDVVQGRAEGKALDLSQASGARSFDCNIIGTTDWQQTAGSDLVIITSGLTRSVGMTRDDLLVSNCDIVKSVCKKVAKFSPDSIVIVVCNPLDAMVAVAESVLGFSKNRVMGMAGTLDAARFACFISQELGVSCGDIDAIVLGGHGETMLPLPRYTSVAGIPLTELLTKEKIDQLIDRTRDAGRELIALLGYSAYYAAGDAVVVMAEAILGDQKKLITCCAWCQKEYGLDGFFAGVPVILGANGIERIIELDLNSCEMQAFQVSVDHVKCLTSRIDHAIKNS